MFSFGLLMGFEEDDGKLNLFLRIDALISVEKKKNTHSMRGELRGASFFFFFFSNEKLTQICNVMTNMPSCLKTVTSSSSINKH